MEYSNASSSVIIYEHGSSHRKTNPPQFKGSLTNDRKIYISFFSPQKTVGVSIFFVSCVS